MKDVDNLPCFLLGFLSGILVTLTFTKFNYFKPLFSSGRNSTKDATEETAVDAENDCNDLSIVDNVDETPEDSIPHERESESISNDQEETTTTTNEESTQDQASVVSNSSNTTNTNLRVSIGGHSNSSSNNSNSKVIAQAREFEQTVLQTLSSGEEIKMALRRTRAVNSLAHMLTEARDERECFEVASNLIVPLFGIDACAFLLSKDSETMLIKHATVSKRKFAINLGLEGGPDGVEVPLNKSVAALCAKTLQQHYTPRTKDSPFPNQRNVTYRLGLNTQLTTPIIVNNDKFAGCLACSMEKEDAFSDIDRMLINNVAHMLGSSVYAKRLRLAAENSNKISREMLHSMIPAKVIKKIECFWDETTKEYQRRRSSPFVASQCNSTLDDSDRDFCWDENELILDACVNAANNINVNNSNSNNNTHDDNQCQTPQKHQKMERRHSTRQSITNKINLLNEMNRDGSDHVGVVIDTSAMEITSTHRALYAETVPNVCIIFTDIVGFSQISLDLTPIKVMNLLQDLFSRFDALCDRYGIQKLETIGDAYICTSGMFDEDVNKNDDAAVAACALKMAKAMVREARAVSIPKKNCKETLEIRVGIHRGDLTCGVLGERLPKFTVFGSSVNLAARMEQTCFPSRIRVTKDFFDLLPETQVVEAREVIPVKNMGEVETYLLNPLKERHIRGESGSSSYIKGESGSSSLYD